jgi:lipoprotein-anchoring transpeptidase ErfK/SrfK
MTAAMPKRRLVVDSRKQNAVLQEDGHIIRRYVISTSAEGLGCEPESFRTPPGRLTITEKIGAGLPEGAILRGRKSTGETWSPSTAETFASEDLVLTRILWLSGLEPHNANTRERYVYLHGTNHENLLGKPASQGCVRFSNRDIVELFDLLEAGDEVEVI